MTDTRQTRTKADREALDAAVLAVLSARPHPTPAVDLASATGATLLQVRSAIRRLGARVAARGNTRARVYSLATQAAA